jgi:hypothetical protein
VQREEARRDEGDLASKDGALTAALRQSARWNESQLILGGCTFLTQSYCAVVQVRPAAARAGAVTHATLTHPHTPRFALYGCNSTTRASQVSGNLEGHTA